MVLKKPVIDGLFQFFRCWFFGFDISPRIQRIRIGIRPLLSMGFGCSVGFSPQQQVAMAGFGFFGFQRIGTKRVFGFSGSGYF